MCAWIAPLLPSVCARRPWAKLQQDGRRQSLGGNARCGFRVAVEISLNVLAGLLASPRLVQKCSPTTGKDACKSTCRPRIVIGWRHRLYTLATHCGTAFTQPNAALCVPGHMLLLLSSSLSLIFGQTLYNID